MHAEPVRTAIVGCGNISTIYLRNMQRLRPLKLVACADLVPQRAEAQAAAFGIAARSVADLLADPQIELIVNLTVPGAHFEVARAALRAGKSVYNEKPLALTRDEGRELVELAGARGLRIGCAPDTFLGAGYQTARRHIDAGLIGRPVAGAAHMVCHGHEGWHPAPQFYYEPGGGPLFDMGPYYLTALVSLLGPVRRVCGSSRITFPQRTITSQPHHGTVIDVRTPTHIAGVLDFVDGPIVTLVTSFDVWHANLPLMEIYGETGSLVLPDPNGFGGPLRLRRAADREWSDVPLECPYATNSRGLGPADLAAGLRSGQPHRASGELALHVLDVMQAIQESSVAGRHMPVSTTCRRPEPLPPEPGYGELGADA